jgi:hypothetical protein
LDDAHIFRAADRPVLTDPYRAILDDVAGACALTFDQPQSLSVTETLARRVPYRRFRAHLVDVRANVSSHAEMPIRCGSY